MCLLRFVGILRNNRTDDIASVLLTSCKLEANSNQSIEVSSCLEVIRRAAEVRRGSNVQRVEKSNDEIQTG